MKRRDSPEKSRSDGGFTLIELMVVVVILGLLYMVVQQTFFGETDRARLRSIQVELKNIQSACERYAVNNNGRWPRDMEELIQVEEGGDRYLDTDEVPTDPWNNPYRIDRNQDGRFVVICDGPDGSAGTDDDIDTINVKKVTIEEFRQWQKDARR